MAASEIDDGVSDSARTATVAAAIAFFSPSLSPGVVAPGLAPPPQYPELPPLSLSPSSSSSARSGSGAAGSSRRMEWEGDDNNANGGSLRKVDVMYVVDIWDN
ncbi:hypothetical protein E2562_021629 [Oryza meyeriana var. granulata]|uniref:Uncharacterized protein n=1 Tax=Oryza meyeriana var. granulata TaxID=110450 RepID=A0A6G1DZN9_9ORYZ|nr:hypothetical protein E2562_021629 [Oryza meyeriana var. granulata]